MPTTRTIAGHAFTLIPGRRYVASRPMAGPGVDSFLVTITDVTFDHGFDSPAVATAGPLDYDAANALLAAFNDGPASFLGRTWE